jgi:hypothetical protein
MQSTEQLSAILLDPTAETTIVNGACAALYDLFVRAASATADAVRGTAASRRLTAGLALSPALAGLHPQLVWRESSPPFFTGRHEKLARLGREP